MTAPHATRPGRSGEDGVITLELIVYYGIVMFVVVATLQLFVAGYVAVAASNAARTAARLASMGEGGAEAAAMESLTPGLQDGATVAVAGGQATVQVDIPALLPVGGPTLGTLTRTAEMPETAEPVEVGAMAPGAAGGRAADAEGTLA